MSLEKTKYRLEFLIFLECNVHTAIGEHLNYVLILTTSFFPSKSYWIIWASIEAKLTDFRE